MKLPLYQVDAFTDQVFRGNPAAVCPLKNWLEDETMQAIASENNLSETAFFVKNEDHFDLRWFTPTSEVDLCGHATLAAAFVILSYMDKSLTQVDFETTGGHCSVSRDEDVFWLDFPARPATECPIPDELLQGLGIRPSVVLQARDYLAVYDSEEQIKAIEPDMNRLSGLESLGIIVTAAGEEVDFVSRFFAPKVGVPEDPVTGSAHCTLIPYWAEQLEKTSMTALQLSRRGGTLFCENQNRRVRIGGKAVLYMVGTIWV